MVAVFVGLVADGMDLQMLSLALPNLSAELHLSHVRAGALATYTLLGMAGGGLLGGWAADRFGRVRVTAWAIASFTVTTVVLAFTHGYLEFAIVRFLSGLGLGCLYSIGNVLAAEYVPGRVRTTILSVLQAGWSVGYVVAAILATYLLPAFGWRPLFAFALVPGIVCMVLLRGVNDPESWFASRRAAQALGKPRNAYRKIWADKTTRATFMFWCGASTALQFGYYGANTWLPSYLVTDLGLNLKNMGWYMAATYTSMIVGKIATGYLADVFGRRIVWVLSGFATAAALPLIMLFATASNVAGLLIVFGLLYGAPYALLAAYMSESFPTSVRGTGMAAAHAIGRTGSTISPLMIGWAATNYSIALGIALLGIAYAICGLIPGLFIREKMYDPMSATPVEAVDTEAGAVLRGALAGQL